MAQFYFAWADASETVFAESAHAVVDEDVFDFDISQSEGDFAELRVSIRNPSAGLLSPDRQQWAWFSWDAGGSAGVEPLFFGRIVGVPDQVAADVVTVVFVARPANYDALRTALAQSLKVLPYYDPVWINPQLWNDPDSALEARPALWHVHRVTHELTASDIVSGGGATYSVADHFYDSLSISFRQRPANKVSCVAEVRWNNEARGSVDITQALLDAFAAAGSSQGAPFITSYTGEGLARDWPLKGDRIGGGWEVGDVTLERVDGRGAPQLIYPIRTNAPVHAAFPLWTFRPTFQVAYEVSRSYSERVSFSFSAEVQPLVADTDSDDTILVEMSSSALTELIDLDGSVPAAPLRDARYRSFFKSDRGKQSLEYLICLCRARLLSSARAVEVSFEVPFEDVAGISCDDNVTIMDVRLPGGEASGKVVGYSLSLDGDSGRERAVVRIACTLGRGGSVETVAGSWTYAEAGYVEAGYQAVSGGATAIAGVISYASIDGVAINDDGIDLGALSPSNVVLSLVVVDGETAQETVLSSRVFEDLSDAIDALNGVPTQVALSLRPLTGGPFETSIPVTVSDLVIPQTIDLEAGSSI